MITYDFNLKSVKRKCGVSYQALHDIFRGNFDAMSESITVVRMRGPNRSYRVLCLAEGSVIVRVGEEKCMICICILIINLLC